MLGYDIIVIGASAGGAEALQVVAGGLPPDLQAAIFVVLHLPPAGPSFLPEILSRAGPLPAVAGWRARRSPPAASMSRPQTTTCWSSQGACG